MEARKTRNTGELARCLEIRRVVFVVEQKVALNLELDGLEGECAHFLVWPGSDESPMAAVGTARLWVDPDGVAKAQRVAVLSAARGKGAGRALMCAIEDEVRTRGMSSLVLGAQVSAIPFYERIGYTVYGDSFDDAGIPHRMMRRTVASPPV